jgi:hypothetical protein
MGPRIGIRSAPSDRPGAVTGRPGEREGQTHLSRPGRGPGFELWAGPEGSGPVGSTAAGARPARARPGRRPPGRRASPRTRASPTVADAGGNPLPSPTPTPTPSVILGEQGPVYAQIQQEAHRASCLMGATRHRPAMTASSPSCRKRVVSRGDRPTTSVARPGRIEPRPCPAVPSFRLHAHRSTRPGMPPGRVRSGSERSAPRPDSGPGER